MSIQLSGGDVIDLAVQTEVRGERFYRAAAEGASSQQAKDLFQYLADQELIHKKVFEGLSSAIVITDIDATAWDEAMAYIAATVGREFFSVEAKIRAIPLGATEDDRIGQAIEFEKQTLLFFYGLRDLVQATNKETVDEIIDQEKSHIRRLSEMRAELA